MNEKMLKLIRRMLAPNWRDAIYIRGPRGNTVLKPECGKAHYRGIKRIAKEWEGGEYARARGR